MCLFLSVFVSEFVFVFVFEFVFVFVSEYVLYQFVPKVSIDERKKLNQKIIIAGKGLSIRLKCVKCAHFIGLP